MRTKFLPEEADLPTQWYTEAIAESLAHLPKLVS